jgi:putative transposase
MRDGKKDGVKYPHLGSGGFLQHHATLQKLCQLLRHKMLVLESKLRGTTAQYETLDEMIRTGRFVRNSCLRYWMDNQEIGRYDLNKYCKVLADNPEFPWAKKLNSMARQAMAERAWSAIARFYDNCKKGTPGKKGFPRFQKHQTRASIEYKTSGWKLSDDKRGITFTDGFNAGTFKMWGTRDLHFYQIDQIKRVRIVRRADGYYVQFCVDVDRDEAHEFQNRIVGIDMGLNHFYTDSDGNQVVNPRFLRKAELALKKAQRRVSKKMKRPVKKGDKVKQSNNYKKAKNRLSRKHLKVQRRRKDFALKTARALILSSDLVAIEDLKVTNMVKNHHLAKSISDAAWTLFREQLEYFGKIFQVPVIAVAPHFTSINCSSCGEKVEKTLSTRTHTCYRCGHIQDRDWNAAINILNKALQSLSKNNTVGHTEINAWGEIGLCLEGETLKSKPTRHERTRKHQ